MADVELIGLDEDGEHVVLAASDGTRFRLRIDEQLRAAVRRDRPQLEQLRATAMSSLSPREIQAHIRAGLSADDVARNAGISIDHVRRYEGPVLAEREFIADQARRTRVGRDAGSPMLGELVTDRLAVRGVEPDALVWDAARPGSGGWVVSVEFPERGSTKRAEWAFDASARTVSARDDESRGLSETAVADSPVPRRHLSPVRSRVFDIESAPFTAPEPTPAEAPEPDAAPVDRTGDLLHDLRARRGVRQEVEVEIGVEDDESAGEFEGFGPQQAFHFDLPPAAEPEGRLFTLRPSSASPADGVEDGPATAPFAPIDAPQAPEPTSRPTEPAPAASDDVPPPLERAKPARKGRAKVPSWDEIVFGAKPEE